VQFTIFHGSCRSADARVTQRPEVSAPNPLATNRFVEDGRPVVIDQPLPVKHVYVFRRKRNRKPFSKISSRLAQIFVQRHSLELAAAQRNETVKNSFKTVLKLF